MNFPMENSGPPKCPEIFLFQLLTAVAVFCKFGLIRLDMKNIHLLSAALTMLPLTSGHAVTVWQVGLDDNDWPMGDGGGPNASFVQEAGVNPLPGDPNSPELAQMADDDYYLAGVYSTVQDGGDYIPVGTVENNEEAAERAFAGDDNSLRYHFNLPVGTLAGDQFSITFDAFNLHIDEATHDDPRYGVEVYVNNILVMPEVVVRPDDLDFDYTTPTFTIGDVNLGLGPGPDNYVELRGINYNAEGGGNWMGIDYVQMDVTPIPEPSSTGLILFAGLLGFLPFFRRRRRA